MKRGRLGHRMLLRAKFQTTWQAQLEGEITEHGQQTSTKQYFTMLTADASNEFDGTLLG